VFVAGQAELQRGNLDAAERDFKEVLAADPKGGPAYTNLGVIAMRRKEVGRGAGTFEEGGAVATE